jgi:hypothetical protein
MIDRRQLLMGAGALLSASLVAAAPSDQNYENPDDMYEALRRQRATPLDVAGGKINVVFADGAPGLNREPVLRWIQKSARAISTYFGTYPTRDYGLLIVSAAGDRVGHATTYGYHGSATRIYVGVDADERAFAEDWILVHEMVHAALPDLPRRALWVQEGSATWLEPIARAQAGELPVSEVWRQAVNGMPKGMPASGSGGMDGTHEWGRLYWGGATFWLEAEIAIYRQSGGHFLLCDALRAISRASGGSSADWSPEQMMAVGDKATGTTALTTLYEKFSSRAFDGDLANLFKQLGVTIDSSGSIRFDQTAELAPLTRLITLPLHHG